MTRFLPYSVNIIINIENKHLFSSVEGGAPIGDYSLPVVTGEQRRWWDCSGLDRRSKDISWYTNAPMVFVQEGTVVVTGNHFVKISGFLLIILARLCWLTSWKVLAWRHSLVTNNLRSHQMYITRKASVAAIKRSLSILVNGWVTANYSVSRPPFYLPSWKL